MLSHDALKTIFRNESLPLAFVDLDSFLENTQFVSDSVRQRDQSKKIRIATKSIRVPALMKKIFSTSVNYSGLMIYSARELPLLISEGFDDFFLAYPVTQQADLQWIRQAVNLGKKLKLVIDSSEHLFFLAQGLSGLSAPLELVVDVDASLSLFGVHVGVRRSPVRSLDQILNLVELIKDFPQFKFGGLMLYEAQVAGLADRSPQRRLVNPLLKWLRHRSIKHVFKMRREIVDAFSARKIPLEFFNGGGSGSLNFSVEEPWLTEVTAGSAFFAPHSFDHFSNIQFSPSSFFALPVVRKSDPDLVTCFGGGYSASGEAGFDRLPIPVMPQGLSILSAEGCGEVQTPLQGASVHQLKLGDPVIFRHAKAGELMTHFNEVVLISRGKIVGREKTYRGLGLDC